MSDLIVGSRDQWAAFERRNPKFLSRLDELRGVIAAVFSREWESDQPIDRFVFASGAFAIDDFYEVLLACGNAEASAGQKLLRPMFERVVTLEFVEAHPEQLDLYLDFSWLSQWKLIKAIQATFRPGVMDTAAVKEAQTEYERVSHQYRIADCKECGTTRLNFSWTPMDMVSMAQAVGMADLIVPCYYIPLQYTHPGARDMLNRLTGKEGRFDFRPRVDPQGADRVLCAAHALVIHVLGLECNHFGLDLSLFNGAEDGFKHSWAKENQAGTTGV